MKTAGRMRPSLMYSAITAGIIGTIIRWGMITTTAAWYQTCMNAILISIWTTFPMMNFSTRPFQRSMSVTRPVIRHAILRVTLHAIPHAIRRVILRVIQPVTVEGLSNVFAS